MKVLIVGVGSIAHKHIDALMNINKNIDIYAYRSSFLAKKHDVITDIFTIEEVKNKKYDFIIISNPTSKHFEVLELFKDLDVPLFIEKPLFNNVGEKEKKLVFELSRKITYTACNLRFLNSLQQIKKLIFGKRINEVNVYCGSYLPDWRPGIDFRTIYSSNANMGGGVHLDLIHELDYVYWIFGEPIHSMSVFKNNSSLEISSVDYANYLWEYPEYVVSVVLNYYRRDPKRTLEVVCDDGSYIVDILKNEIYFNNDLIFSSSQLITETYYSQMIFFIREIISKKQKFNSIEESYKILDLCLKG